MLRSLVKIGLVLVAGIIIYNFFFGTSEEKEQSRKIFGQVRGLVVATAELVRSEKAKFDAGKYDKALEQIGGAYRAIREQAEFVDKKVMTRLDELESRKAQLEQELDEIEAAEQETPAPAPKKGAKRDTKAEAQAASKAADQQRKKEALQRALDSLIRDTDQLLQDAQQDQ